MLEIAYEFRCAPVRHRDHPETISGWGMELTGKIDGIGNTVRSAILREYPRTRQRAMFFSRATRQVKAYFEGAAYQADKAEVISKRPGLIVLPGGH